MFHCRVSIRIIHTVCVHNERKWDAVNDPCGRIVKIMSWLVDLANKAESILNTIDETTATVLTTVDDTSTNLESMSIIGYYVY